MSQTYEIRLKKEFGLLQKLERHPNVKGIIKIYYTFSSFGFRIQAV